MNWDWATIMHSYCFHLPGSVFVGCGFTTKRNKTWVMLLILWTTHLNHLSVKIPCSADRGPLNHKKASQGRKWCWIADKLEERDHGEHTGTGPRPTLTIPTGPVKPHSDFIWRRMHGNELPFFLLEKRHSVQRFSSVRICSLSEVI